MKRETVSFCPACESPRGAPAFTAPDVHGTARYSDERFPVARCGDCGAYYLSSRPTAEDLWRFYPSAYYGIEGPEPLLLKWFYRWSGAVKAGWVRPWVQRGTWLDVGCGSGRFLMGLDPSRWERVGLEPNERGGGMIQEASIKMVRRTLDEADLAPGSVDVVSCWHVLEHVAHPRAMLAAAAKILKHDGVLICAVPNTSSWGFRWFREHWFHGDAPRHLVQYDRHSLHRLLTSCGFIPCGWRAQAYELPLDLWHSASSRWPILRTPLVAPFAIFLTLTVKFFERWAGATETLTVIAKKT